MQGDSRLMTKLFELIPVYPKEITTRELIKELNISNGRLCALMNSASSDCLVGEYSEGITKFYTYPNEKCKIKTLEFLRNGGIYGGPRNPERL